MSSVSAKQLKPTALEHFRTRPPSEKPTEQDGDATGAIIGYNTSGDLVMQHWSSPVRNLRCWLPGHLPAHLVPVEETPQQRSRRLFEEHVAGTGYDLITRRDRQTREQVYVSKRTVEAWKLWQSAAQAVNKAQAVDAG